MPNQYHLFHEVEAFYSNLLDTLSNAKKTISMLYFIYDQGDWSGQMNEVLIAKHQAGVRVRMMTDYLGTFTDHPCNIANNRKMVKQLRKAGVEFTFFNPSGPRMSFLDRLHIKMCAVDEDFIFLGGSNIGDYYTSWLDTNLQIHGNLSRTGHDLFDFVHNRSKEGPSTGVPKMNLSASCCGDAKVILTVPGARRDIHSCLVNLVLNAQSPTYFRYWYFLPSRELLNAMLSQLENGLELNILVSHSTRVPVIDWVNRIALRKLKLAGASICRYKKKNMHSKIAWTESGDVIFGSANIESRGLSNNFELCIRINNRELADELSKTFWSDCH